MNQLLNELQTVLWMFFAVFVSLAAIVIVAVAVPAWRYRHEGNIEIVIASRTARGETGSARLKVLLAGAAAVAVLFFAACGGNEKQTETPQVRQTSPPVADEVASEPAGECELASLDGKSPEEIRQRIDDWEDCKKPRPPSPPFVMPAKGSQLAETAGKEAVRTIRQNHASSGLTRSDWLDQGLTLQGMAETDTGNIVFDCYNASISAAINNDLRTEEWKQWENLDGTIYKSFSSERGESWTSQFDKYFMEECLAAAAVAARSWDSTTASTLASCSEQYSRIVSLDDVWLNKPWQLEEHCSV